MTPLVFTCPNCALELPENFCPMCGRQLPLNSPLGSNGSGAPLAKSAPEPQQERSLDV